MLRVITIRFFSPPLRYEFGRDLLTGKIILADELHTCDSSRFWELDSFQDGKEPVRFDKDIIREWVKAQCDPYTQPIPSIPDELRQTTSKRYIEFYERLTQLPFRDGFPSNDVMICSLTDKYVKDIHPRRVTIFTEPTDSFARIMKHHSIVLQRREAIANTIDKMDQLRRTLNEKLGLCVVENNSFLYELIRSANIPVIHVEHLNAESENILQLTATAGFATKRL